MALVVLVAQGEAVPQVAQVGKVLQHHVTTSEQALLVRRDRVRQSLDPRQTTAVVEPEGTELLLTMERTDTARM